VRKGSKEHRYNERGLEVREDAEGVPINLNNVPRSKSMSAQLADALC